MRAEAGPREPRNAEDREGPGCSPGRLRFSASCRRCWRSHCTSCRAVQTMPLRASCSACDLFVVTFASLVLTFFTGQPCSLRLSVKEARPNAARHPAARDQARGLLDLLDRANVVEVRLTGAGRPEPSSRLPTAGDLILTNAPRGFFDSGGREQHPFGCWAAWPHTGPRSRPAVPKLSDDGPASSRTEDQRGSIRSDRSDVVCAPESPIVHEILAGHREV